MVIYKEDSEQMRIIIISHLFPVAEFNCAFDDRIGGTRVRHFVFGSRDATTAPPRRHFALAHY